MYYAIFITWFPWYSRFLRSEEHSLCKQGLGSWLVCKLGMTWMLTVYALRASTRCPQGSQALWACHHAWCIAQGRQLYGIMITSFCNRGSCDQRRYGGSRQFHLPVPKLQPFPGYWALLQWRLWQGAVGKHPPPPRVFGSSIRDRCVVSPI